MQFNEWIEQAYALGASDLHLEADTPVVVRVRGELQAIGASVARDTLIQAHELAQKLSQPQGQPQPQGGSSTPAAPPL